MNFQSKITKWFKKIKLDSEWSFTERRRSPYLTHDYHRYPAKFIPDLVSKLIENYAIPKEKIVDPFAGCGTTLVESRVHGFTSVGTDVNPVATLITKAKIQHIKPQKLKITISKFLKNIEKYNTDCKTIYRPSHERIDYWFFPSEKKKISYLYSQILKITDKKEKIFFLCALSNILKNCSKWLQSSTKPQIDPNKKISDPFQAIEFQLKKMEKQNEIFFNTLKKEGNISTKSEIRLADARKTHIKSNSIGTIITSPPYVTSYEYADIHQLTGYWFDYFKDLSTFRPKFIGTFYSGRNFNKINTQIGQEIIDELKQKDTRTAKEVSVYFNDMYLSIKEMVRILKKGGRVCLVIGNTNFMGVHIKSAEAITELLMTAGLKIKKIIRREIPNKIIPTIRDTKTGKFTTLSNKNSKKVYPEEYILIAEKH